MPKRPSWKSNVAKVLAAEPKPPQLSLTEAAAPMPSQPVSIPASATALDAALARIKELEDGLRYAVAFVPRQARRRSEWLASEKCRELLRLPN